MIGEPGAGDVPMLRNGYHYRILTAQGASAPGGAYSYVINGRLLAGFALIAYPATYRTTGVMTFIVNHYGDVSKESGSRHGDNRGEDCCVCTGRELAPGRRLISVTSRSGWRLSPDLSGLKGLENRSSSGAVVPPVMTKVMASSTLQFVWTTSSSGTISMYPEVGLGEWARRPLPVDNPCLDRA